MAKLKALVAALLEEDPGFLLERRRSRSRTVTPGSSRRGTPKSKHHKPNAPKRMSTPEVLRAKTLTLGEECAMAKAAG